MMMMMMMMRTVSYGSWKPGKSKLRTKCQCPDAPNVALGAAPAAVTQAMQMARHMSHMAVQSHSRSLTQC
jgi:hypothetical protein